MRPPSSSGESDSGIFRKPESGNPGRLSEKKTVAEKKTVWESKQDSDMQAPSDSGLDFALASEALDESKFGSKNGTIGQDLNSVNEPIVKLRPAIDQIEDQFIGRYKILSFAGRGGMGIVYKALDPELSRHVALKIPRVDVCLDKRQRQRFFREAETAAKLRHPNLVDILDIGDSRYGCYLATRWCDGGDLATWLETQTNAGTRLRPQSVALFLSKIARAIADCHQHNIAHLDLKPANILLESPAETLDDANPMVTDFGIARPVDGGVSLKQSSMLVGTPLYMAPEQIECRFEETGAHSDIFTLGILLHEMLFGRLPIEGVSFADLREKFRDLNRLKLPSDTSVPYDIRVICRRCLELEQSDRYQSAEALATDLELFAQGRQIKTQPVSRVRRFWNWSCQPERMVQAGMTGLLVQATIIIACSCSLFLETWLPIDWESDVFKQFAIEVGLLIGLIHIPTIWICLKARRKVPWVIPLGVLLSVVPLVMQLGVLFFGMDALSIYGDNKLAMVAAYQILAAACGLQTALFILAMPAAIRKLKS